MDIVDYNLPLFDEAVPPAMGPGSKEHTKKWAAKIAGFDGYVFVTPEYNHAPNAALKNAMWTSCSRNGTTRQRASWGYGSTGAVRSVDILRMICANLELADVRAQVSLTFAADFEKFTTFKPLPHQEERWRACSTRWRPGRRRAEAVATGLSPPTP